MPSFLKKISMSNSESTRSSVYQAENMNFLFIKKNISFLKKIVFVIGAGKACGIVDVYM